MDPGKIKYRPNVAAILQRADGCILIAQRFNLKGAWQFPQGGVDAGETHEQALKRELREELSLRPDDYEIQQCKGPYRYLLGNGRTKKGFHGQEQQHYLVHFTGAEKSIDVRTRHPEFSDYRWIQPADFQLDWLPQIKREVYRDVLRDFFGVELEIN